MTHLSDGAKAAFLVALFSAWVSGTKGKACIDLLNKNTCHMMAKYKTCETHPKRMVILCRKTCKFCKLKTACASVKCPHKHVCLVDDNGTAYCKCTVVCSHADNKTGVVCARNGKTYQSICSMKKEQCKEKKDIKVYHYGTCIKLDPCVDFMAEQCGKLAKKGLCRVSPQLMYFYCSRTCRLCRQPAPPPQCFQSRYGCCWNSEEAATGPNQQGCKACSEKSFCFPFKALCSKYKSIGMMRQHCPKTCGYC